MLIKKLHLVGYKRLFLNNINELIYEPCKNICIILGSNGSGKSSLLRELTPLPSNLKKDFNEDGFKEITIEHNNGLYIVSSGKYVKNKHSFILDGVECNPAGTKRVQQQLVLEHFKITPILHEVMLGTENFTGMSVNDRKAWFTNISNIDYTYPLSIYSKLKQRHRDIVGAIKISQTKLIKEELSLIDKEYKDTLYKNLEALKETLDLVLTEKSVSTHKPQNDIDMEIGRLSTGVKMYMSNMIKEENVYLTNIDKLLYENTIEAAQHERIITETSSILDEIQLVENTILENDEKEISSKIDTLNSEIEALNISLYLDVNIKDISKINNLFKYVYPDIVSMLSQLMEFSNVTISKEDMSLLLAKQHSLTEDIHHKTSLLNKLIAEKEHLDEAKVKNVVKCEKCEHSWSLGFTQKDYSYTLRKIDEIGKTIIETGVELSNVVAEINTYNEREEHLAALRKAIRDNNLLNSIWDYVFKKHNILTEMALIIDLLYTILTDLDKWDTYDTLLASLHDLYKEKDVLDVKRKIELRAQLKDKAKLEDKLHISLELKNTLDKRQIDLREYKTKLLHLDKVHDKLHSLLISRKSNLNSDLLNLKNNALIELVGYLKMEIASIEKILVDSEYAIKNTVTRENEITELSNKERVLKLMIQELSPTEGLIAKSIASFLTIFTKDMNYIINSIWSYSMEVQPCTVDDSLDLDYKFTVVVDKKTTIEDVSKTSASMQEVIDLAFKIVSMKHLGLDTHPLILDEFGRTADSYHRLKAYSIIDTLANSSFEQVFIVSHFESVYTRFTNADIVVLSEDNLMLDRDLSFNNTLIIK